MALLPYFTILDIKAGDTVFRQGDDDYDTIVLVRGSIFSFVILGGLAVTTAIAAVRVAHGELAPATADAPGGPGPISRLHQ